MSAESAPKRRRIQRSPSPEYKLDDDNYEPYVPVAQRRQAKLAKLTSWGTDKSKTAAQQQQEQDEREDEEREEERRREKARKERTLLMEAQEVHERKAAEGMFVAHCIPYSRVKLSCPQKTRRRRKPKRQRKQMQRYLLLSRAERSSHPTSNWPRACSTPNL